MRLDLFRSQDNIVVKPTRHSLEQLSCYTNVSFGYPPSSNQEDLACLIDKIVQNDWFVIQSYNVV